MGIVLGEPCHIHDRDRGLCEQTRTVCRPHMYVFMFHSDISVQNTKTHTVQQNVHQVTLGEFINVCMH